MADYKVRFYGLNKSVVAEGVIETPSPQPPRHLALDGTLYYRQDFDGDRPIDVHTEHAVYRWKAQLPEVQVVYPRGVPRG